MQQAHAMLFSRIETAASEELNQLQTVTLHMAHEPCRPYFTMRSFFHYVQLLTFTIPQNSSASWFIK